MMDWFQSLTINEIDLILVALFGIGFLHKSWVEFDILLVSSRLTPPDDRTRLGDAFRLKTLSLAMFTGVLGIVFILRGIPGWEESRETVFLIRSTAFVAFIWNQIQCYHFRRELRNRLLEVTDGVTMTSKEGML